MKHGKPHGSSRVVVRRCRCRLPITRSSLRRSPDTSGVPGSTTISTSSPRRCRADAANQALEVERVRSPPGRRDLVGAADLHQVDDHAREPVHLGRQQTERLARRPGSSACRRRSTAAALTMVVSGERSSWLTSLGEPRVAQHPLFERVRGGVERGGQRCEVGIGLIGQPGLEVAARDPRRRGVSSVSGRSARLLAHDPRRGAEQRADQGAADEQAAEVAERAVELDAAGRARRTRPCRRRRRLGDGDHGDAVDTSRCRAGCPDVPCSSSSGGSVVGSTWRPLVRTSPSRNSMIVESGSGGQAGQQFGEPVGPPAQGLLDQPDVDLGLPGRGLHALPQHVVRGEVPGGEREQAGHEQRARDRVPSRPASAAQPTRRGYRPGHRGGPNL